MTNLIKADLRRSTKGLKNKLSIIIPALIMVALMLLLLRDFNGSPSEVINITDASGNEIESLADTGINFTNDLTQGVNVQFVNTLMAIFSFCVVILLGIAVGIIGTNDFTDKSVKNIIASGISRNEYVFSKFISTTLMLLGLMLLYSIASIIPLLFAFTTKSVFQVFLYEWIIIVRILPVYIAMIIASQCALYISGNELFTGFAIVALATGAITTLLQRIASYLKFKTFMNITDFFSYWRYPTFTNPFQNGIIDPQGNILDLSKIDLYKYWIGDHLVFSVIAIVIFLVLSIVIFNKKDLD